MGIAAEAVSWSTSRKPIISGVTLELRDGEMLGLIGPNGSGKSTLMRVLSGVEKPEKGHVKLGGQDMHRISRKAVARQIAFVEQAADTSDLISVYEAVALGRTPWQSSLSPWSSGDDQKVRAALAEVGMEDHADRSWHTLSGGERQRVHIARALAQEPQVLLLDEPTNHLDIRHQVGILNLIRSLGRTTMIALHDLNSAFLCDRVGVMQQGRLIALGPPSELLTDHLIRTVFGVNVRFVPDALDPRPLLRFSAQRQPGANGAIAGQPALALAGR